jgi:hypothetical protein
VDYRLGKITTIYNIIIIVSRPNAVQKILGDYGAHNYLYITKIEKLFHCELSFIYTLTTVQLALEYNI